MNKRLAELKKAYEQTPIPQELHETVARLCRQEQPRARLPFWKPLAIAACALVVFVAGINALPAVAESLEQVPCWGLL